MSRASRDSGRGETHTPGSANFPEPLLLVIPSLVGRWARPGGRQHSRCLVTCIRPLLGVFFRTGLLFPRRAGLRRKLNWLLAAAAGGGLLFLSPGRLQRQKAGSSQWAPPVGRLSPSTLAHPDPGTMESTPGGSLPPRDPAFPPHQQRLSESCRPPALQSESGPNH